MSWVKKTLGVLCTIQKGKIGIKKATPGEYPLVVTAEERLSHNECHFEGNAVVIPLVSSTGHGHKSLKRIHFQSGKFAVGNILCAVIPKDESVLRADYLYRFLDLNREKELVSRMKGMANVTLPMKEIAKIEIPIPPIETQIDFVQQYAVLEEKSNDLGEEITHQLDLVKQLRQAFLREAMQGKLVLQDENDEPASVLLEKIKAEKGCLIKEKKIKKQKPLPPITEDEIPFEIHENWVWCRLGDLVLSFQNGISSRGSSVGENITVLRLADIRNNFVDLSDRREIKLKKSDYERYLLDESDLLITRVNGSLDLVGNFNYVGKHDIPIAACDHFVRMTLSKSIYSTFIFLSGKIDHLRRNIEDNFKTTSGQKTVNQGHLSALLIALPPLTEQQRIVAKLDELMQYCDELEVSIKESQQQNELLLQQVLREALEPKEKEVEI